MAPWLRVLEAYLVQLLLRTPAFHRGVEKVARQVHRVRHGIPPEEMGGTKIDQPGNSSFLKHFNEEVQAQLGRAEANGGEQAARPANKIPPEQNVAQAEGADAVWESVKKQAPPQKVAEEEGADAAWEKARKQTESGAKRGFIGEYIEALREQTKSGK
jgi:hypothetical protein